ncbi:MAG TPA: MBL fold metallo-hydrolase [Gaiellaceae bacterium]|nr:MBL fold metallo-hydrolase [Gaiellaceae bacterium]
MVVGEVQISSLPDALGDLGEFDELFPTTTDWDAYREAYPSSFNGSRFRFPVVTYLLRSGGRNVLVDTGAGPRGLWDEWDPERAAELPDALAAQGAEPEEVDVVFFTHLHIDHVGWNTDDHGRPFFPNARYVVHRDALAFARGEGRRTHTPRTIDPIEFEELDGEAELAPGITTTPLPGHYPGHMGVRIRLGGGGEAFVLGDAAAHPMLFDRPADTFASDVDEAGSIQTRERLLPELVDTGVLVLCGHFPDGGIGRLLRRDGRVLWTAV